MKTRKQIGREVKMELARRGLRNGEFAKTIGIPAGTLSYIINATPHRYSDFTLLRVTSALGLSLSITEEVDKRHGETVPQYIQNR